MIQNARRRTLLLTALTALLYVLHQDVWFWRSARPLVFGALPIGFFYHAVFTLAASALMWLLVSSAWPSDLEEHDAPSPRDDGDRAEGR